MIRTNAPRKYPRPICLFIALVAGSILSLISTGCGVGAAAPGSTGASASVAASIGGRVHGGNQPVTGASIQLLAVGTSGDGSASTSLMQFNSLATTVTTDSNGNFVLSNKYTCPSSPTYVYLLASGGNPGLANGTNNAQLKMLTGLGLCSSLSSTQFITVNEVTTVATVAALAPYVSSATAIGSGTSDAASLAAAMALIPQYVNTATGAAPGPALPNGSTAPSPVLYALANSLASCVNSAGGASGDGSACGSLFADVEAPFGAPPTDLVGATLDILDYPNINVSTIFNLGAANAPFVTTQTTPPNDWTLPITYKTGTVSTQHTAYTVTEGAATVPILFNRNDGSPTNAVSVSYSLYNGTAVAGIDFPVTSGTVSWAAGNNAQQTLNLPIYNPGFSGGSNRSFHLALNTPVGVALAANEYTQINITDSDTALAFTTTALPDGTPGTGYSQAVTATGGVGTLTYSLAPSSSLPAGLSLSSAGVVSGTPTTLQTVNTTFVVTDQATPTNQSVQVTLPIVVTTGLAYQVSNLPTGTPAQAIQKALLTWGLTMVNQLNANGQTTDASNLTTDITNDLNITFTVPSTLPANLFPAIPSIATNPSVTGEISSLNSKLATDAASPEVYPYSYTASSDAANDILLAQQMTWALLYSGQSLYLNPSLIASIMTRMESGTYAMSKFGPDFTTTSSVPLLYLMLTQGWSQLVFPSRQAAWLSLISANQSAVVNGSVGTHLALGPNNVGDNWINADVKWMEGVAYAAIALGTPQTAIVQGGLAEMAASIFPDGGTNYIEIQNEACEYHPIYGSELARYALVTGDNTGYTLAKATLYYYPLSFEPGNVCEYITAPANKKYWDTNNGGEGQEIAAYLNSDPYNYYVLQQTGFPSGFDAAVYYNSSITGQSLPSSWIAYDKNSQGPHGVFNNSSTSGFSFQSSTRDVDMPGAQLGEEGLPTFVGGMLVDSTASNASWSLNGAVERIGNTVNYKANDELNLTDASFADLAVSPHAAQTTTSTFGAVSTIHNLEGYEGKLTSWLQTETWILLPTRVIGLCSMVNTAAETAYQVEGAVHFVSGRSTWGAQKTLTALTPTEYAYSVASDSQSMVWQVFSHNYANITTEYSSTYSADGANKASNLLLNDQYNSATSQHTWPMGTSHYFFSEFRPSSSTAAVNPTILTGLPTGLVGFSFTDSTGTFYQIVHNPTSAAVAYTAPSGTVTMSGTQYRPSWIDPTGTESVPSATYAGSIPAYSHIVIVH